MIQIKTGLFRWVQYFRPYHPYASKPSYRVPMSRVSHTSTALYSTTGTSLHPKNYHTYPASWISPFDPALSHSVRPPANYPPALRVTRCYPRGLVMTMYSHAVPTLSLLLHKMSRACGNPGRHAGLSYGWGCASEARSDLRRRRSSRGGRWRRERGRGSSSKDRCRCV